MKAILRSSEFWVSIATVIGGLLTNAGIVPKDLWEQSVIPALIYILARIGGKTAKALVK